MSALLNPQLHTMDIEVADDVWVEVTTATWLSWPSGNPARAGGGVVQVRRVFSGRVTRYELLWSSGDPGDPYEVVRRLIDPPPPLVWEGDYA